VGSTRTGSRSGPIAALATVALWCSSFALIKHLVDSGLAAQDVLGGALVIGGVALAQRGTPRKAGMPSGACAETAGGRPC
jgi:hypothetical protein